MSAVAHAGVLRAIRDAYAEAFADVAGVTIDEVRGHHAVTITGTGRSPTLHQVDLRWEHQMGDLTRRLDAPTQKERHDVMDAVERAMEGDAGAVREIARLGLLGPDLDLVDLQAARLGAARGMGLDTPFRLPTRAAILADAGLADACPVAQVAVDAYTPIQIERMILDTRSVVVSRHVVRRTLVSLLAHAHERSTMDGHALFAETTGDVPFEVGVTDRRLQAERRLLVHLDIDGEGTRPLARFDGEALVLLQTLPETVRAAAIGKPLGRVVSTGTVLDARTILDIDAYEAGRIDLTLEMDGVSLAMI